MERTSLNHPKVVEPASYPTSGSYVYHGSNIAADLEEPSPLNWAWANSPRHYDWMDHHSPFKAAVEG